MGFQWDRFQNRWNRSQSPTNHPLCIAFLCISLHFSLFLSIFFISQHFTFFILGQLCGVYRRPMEAIFEIWQIIGFLILRAQASDLRCYGGQIKSDLVPERKCLLVGQKMPSDDLDWMGGQTVNLWPTRCGELSICGSPSCHFGWKDQFHAIHVLQN